jgi:hypothetical protein
MLQKEGMSSRSGYRSIGHMLAKPHLKKHPLLRQLLLRCSTAYILVGVSFLGLRSIPTGVSLKSCVVAKFLTIKGVSKYEFFVTVAVKMP